MEKAVETTGKTVEEAIEKALAQLGAKREDTDIVVLDKGRGGILGLGSEPARVRVSLISNVPDNAEVVDMAKELIETLLRSMGVAASVALPERATVKSGIGQEPVASGNLVFNLEGEDAGLLIGRRGETLSSLQFLVNFILSRKLKGRVSVVIDVEGYKQRRDEALKALASRMAEKVVATGRPVTLEPMPARERRIVHMSLSDHPKVSTESVGQGEARKVTLVLRRSQGERPNNQDGDRTRVP